MLRPPKPPVSRSITGNGNHETLFIRAKSKSLNHAGFWFRMFLFLSQVEQVRDEMPQAPLREVEWHFQGHLQALSLLPRAVPAQRVSDMWSRACAATADVGAPCGTSAQETGRTPLNVVAGSVGPFLPLPASDGYRCDLSVQPVLHAPARTAVTGQQRSAPAAFYPITLHCSGCDVPLFCTYEASVSQALCHLGDFTGSVAHEEIARVRLSHLPCLLSCPAPDH